ncbi:hypothetical protein GLOIN_2v1699734 [Rhizophagus irregularis DAOM 181602=DAOM 197198]|uniref:Uncharacterized protein n=1 Tax=Rhizophagus irregularis (strain DAOM 181602 / DAOM 197198 / MUCL 43194) TaxID=747089 RepID=A0A2P4P9G6_RHIID|nr:hypothetical protein GLOIN_2v1699734 [Rhizophagus irregularis DAOM 181602=DAOM 197198]POG62023.1 hypothetical protein GLOIN_2v1699734 [Rhizophagus irregularis DAOM 181602=DAOM 197198]GET57362.1 hypothetical protein GLOIN_2v1699734 [Rhizophagus irregularis DAOM 181602=DAOM 197198]|eukprot:XP_025168889.1 hypothetical protein GLOIN_2v1699734 [Rhizophagus irregularis DAOM 181602=DAOM 197198]
MSCLTRQVSVIIIIRKLKIFFCDIVIKKKKLVLAHYYSYARSTFFSLFLSMVNKKSINLYKYTIDDIIIITCK